MRRLLLTVWLALTALGCAVDKGPSACVEGARADCTCETGAPGAQTCLGGVYSACSCGSLGGTGGEAGFAGTGGVGAIGGTGGVGAIGGTGGVGAIGGTGGVGAIGGTGGVGAIGGTGGVGAIGGTGGVGAIGGTGGVGAIGGTGGVGAIGGTGGVGAIGGTGGVGGVAGGGGPAPGELWSRCELTDEGSTCNEALVCYRSSLVTSGPGFCTNECTDSNQCESVPGASATVSCGSESVCRFTCSVFNGGSNCPYGMSCVAIEPLVYRCVYSK